MKRIPLKGVYGQGLFTKVSDQDYTFASTLNLYVNDGYVKTYHKGRHWKLHQLLVGSFYDHANQDKLDNTRENLRRCTQQQNNANVVKRAASGYKGVYLDRSCNHWTASISRNGKMVKIGNFLKKEHAALAYDLWARDLHGEFARTNFPILSGSLD
jgi:hypothetical protein